MWWYKFSAQLPKAFKGWYKGYKGIFGINAHYTNERPDGKYKYKNRKFGRLHWDMRFESPIALEDGLSYYFKLREKNKHRELEVIEKEYKPKSVLRSFANPKARMPKDGEKILLILVEDHPVQYLELEYPFEIPEGYGKGIVLLEDKGTFTVEDINNKRVVFDLQGKKYKGKYALVKLRPTDFLFVKVKNE